MYQVILNIINNITDNKIIEINIFDIIIKINNELWAFIITIGIAIMIMIIFIKILILPSKYFNKYTKRIKEREIKK